MIKVSLLRKWQTQGQIWSIEGALRLAVFNTPLPPPNTKQKFDLNQINYQIYAL